MALLAEATLESLQRLADLPAGTLVGVVGDSQTCIENKSRSIEGAGLDHLDLTETYIDHTDEVRALLGRVQVVVCTSATASKLREFGVPEGVDERKLRLYGRSTARRIREPDAPEELEIIEEDRTLDKGGIEMLGRILRSIRTAR